MSSRLRSLRVNLGNLKPAQGSLHKQKRVGRGQGSHHGGTAGKGHNGQNSRSGPGPHASFEGGQTPITRLFPKRGFKNRYVPIQLFVRSDQPPGPRKLTPRSTLTGFSTGLTRDASLPHQRNPSLQESCCILGASTTCTTESRFLETYVLLFSCLPF